MRLKAVQEWQNDVPAGENIKRCQTYTGGVSEEIWGSLKKVQDGFSRGFTRLQQFKLKGENRKIHYLGQEKFSEPKELK